MAGEGLRVFGVAQASFTGATLPDSQHGFAFNFLGLVGLADPLPASVAAGTVALALVAGIYLVALARGMPEAEVRALTFFSLVITIVGLIFVNRSFSTSLITAFRRPNPALAWSFSGSRSASC